jgi:EpsI family protein
LGGSGKKLKKTAKTITLNNEGDHIIFDLNQLVYRDGINEELVYYFYKTGDFIGNSYIHLRFSLARNKISGNGASGSLIRISTPDKIIGNVKPDVRLKRFLEALYPHLVNHL